MNAFDALSQELARRNREELERAGFKPDVTDKPLPNLLRPRWRMWEESNGGYRSEMRDAGRGHLLG